MIDAQWARKFAAEWIEAWNSHDLNRILGHYTDDFEMTSPLIVERMKVESGILLSKDEIWPYWKAGLEAQPPLRFELLDLLVGVNSITIYYRRTSGKTAAEVLIFNEQNKVIKGIAHYGE
jgi:hypothetical protein